MRCWTVLLATTVGCTSLSGLADLSVAPELGDRAVGSGPDGGGAAVDASQASDGGSSVVASDAGAGTDAGTVPGAESPFDFVDVVDAALSSSTTGSAVATGFDGTVAVSVSGGDALIRSKPGPWRMGTTVTAGDKLEIRMTSSPTVSTSITATVTIGSIVIHWTITTGPECPSQTVDWSASGSTCSTSSGAALSPGRTRALTDSTLPATGKVMVTCKAGSLVVSGAVCVPPAVVDVSGPNGCVNGQCLIAANPDGNCAPDAAAATAICLFKGYGASTTFTTTPLVDGVQQCNANGSACVLSTCPAFGTVTCRY